jgi:predicted dehydrogenase
MSPVLAFVGCAHIHTPGFVNAIKKRPGLKVKSVWDPNPARSTRRAADLNAVVIDDFKAIYADPEIGAVIITSETDRHETLVGPAVSAGKKFLFVEKPLGYAAPDAALMAAAIEKAGITFQTGYFRRGESKLMFLKDQVAKGAFGKITRVRASNCHGGSLGGWFDAKPDAPADDWNWMAQPKLAGCGAFGDLGTHILDILIWMFGDVTAATAQLDKGTGRYGDCDETGEGMLRFKSGVIGTLAAAWTDVADPVTFQINGTEGNAYIHGDHLHFKSSHVPNADGKTPWTDLPAPAAAGFEAFLDAVERKPAKLVTPAEAAYRSKVMAALYDGAAKKTWVAV